jgi:hypothetical protein
MAALTAQRNSAEYASPRRLIVPVAASTKIFLGSLVGVDVNGNAVPATSALVVLGRAETVDHGIPGADADNSAGAAGAIKLEVLRGCFSWDINAGDITQANIGQVAFAVDDHTVSSSSNGGARPIAGRIIALDASTGGVFIDSTETSSGVAGVLSLSAAGVAAAGPVTLAGAVVGQKVLLIFGAPTAGGALVAKVPGTDFESVISVAGQIQQLTATDLHLSTFVFVLGTK